MRGMPRQPQMPWYYYWAVSTFHSEKNAKAYTGSDIDREKYKRICLKHG